MPHPSALDNPPWKQETASEASTCVMSALLEPVPQYLLPWQMVVGEDPVLKELKEACAHQVNMKTTERLPFIIKELFFSLLGMK